VPPGCCDIIALQGRNFQRSAGWISGYLREGRGARKEKANDPQRGEKGKRRKGEKGEMGPFRGAGSLSCTGWEDRKPDKVPKQSLGEKMAFPSWSLGTSRNSKEKE
jgi:hypothetical protein